MKQPEEFNCKKITSIHKASSQLKITGSEEIENFTNFEYLDSIINSNKDCSKEVRRRLAMAMQKLNSIKILYAAPASNLQ